MTRKKDRSDKPADIRRQAEQSIRNQADDLPRDFSKLSSDDIRHLFHELRVHKIEIELQNEELRRSQEELETSQARYFDLFNLAPVGYLIVCKKGVVRESNLRISSMLGIDRSELLQKPASRFIFPGDQDSYYHFRRKLLKTKEPQVCELRLKKKDDSWFWAWLEGACTQDKDGNPVYRIIILDITERKKSEELEQLIRELSQSNEHLRKFSYITSHNLRGPLSNITSLVQLLELLPVDHAEFREIVKDLKTSTALLNQTIDDLTKILIIKDNPRIEKEEVNFADVFRRVLRQNRHLLKKHDFRVEYSFEETPSVQFNKTYLESVFLNLFTNALKFRSPARKPEITVRTEDKGDHILLVFQDNGIGLDINKHRDKLFGLYQKFHDHPDSKGLGLYLVKTQIEAFGGSIEAKSKVGQGMTFLIRMRGSG